MIYIWLIALFFIYSILPTLIVRIFSLRVQKKVKNGVALTFDDGPDPVYTPQLLDLLKKYNVKATFFVVGWKAKKYPHLIKRMQEEGHTIGLHHYYHTSNWFLLPLVTEWELERSARVIEHITGVRPVYYRPPWGHLNIWTVLMQKKYKIVMWTYILGDWNASLGVDRLYERLMSSIEDGAIIVLHDRPPCRKKFGTIGRMKTNIVEISPCSWGHEVDVSMVRKSPKDRRTPVAWCTTECRSRVGKHAG